MSKVQFIKTEGGEELAVMPKAEYERLVERADDEDVGAARIVRRAKAAIASGQEILLSKAVVDRLAAGENPIRVLREWRGKTQAELAIHVGITQGYLSDLETGKRKGPFALHEKFSRALGVPLELLTPIAVSDEAADPERFAKQERVIADMRRLRKRR